MSRADRRGHRAGWTGALRRSPQLVAPRTNPTLKSEVPDLDIIQRWAHTVVRMSTSLEPAELLRQHGVRVTAQRLAVVRAVSSRSHVTADDVAEVVEAQIGAISRQGVYDALAVLADKGLIRRIQPAGSPARYEDRVGDNHHHLICRTCGRMVDVNCAVGTTPCLTADDDSGFEIDEAEVIYWGRCPACLAAAEPASGPHSEISTPPTRRVQRRQQQTKTSNSN